MNKIALVSSIRDCPDPYLKFWIQYHLGIGVDHIFIYDNESDTPIVVENPKVTVTRWPGKAGQISAYNDSLSVLKKKDYEWVAYIDDDEFIMLSESDLPTYLNSLDSSTSGIGMNWLMFGSNGQEETIPDGNVFKAFTLGIAEDYSINKHIKTIAKIKQISRIPSPHFVDYEGDSFSVTENGEVINNPTEPVPKAFSNYPSHKRIWVNHYFCRSKEDFSSKIKRGAGGGKQFNGFGPFESINNISKTDYTEKINKCFSVGQY